MRTQATGGRVAPNGAWEGLGTPRFYKQDAPLGLIPMPMGPFGTCPYLVRVMLRGRRPNVVLVPSGEFLRSVEVH